MASGDPKKKKSNLDDYNRAWSKQWGDTTAERAKKQAEGKTEYDSIIQKKRQSDEQDER
jgi:hypothetical protein